MSATSRGAVLRDYFPFLCTTGSCADTNAGGDKDSLARHTDCYERAVTLQTCLTGQTNEGLGQLPHLSRGSRPPKGPRFCFFFSFFFPEEGAAGLSQNAAGALKLCQGGDTLDDAVTPPGRGEMSKSFKRSQVAGTGLMAAVVPLLLMFYTLYVRGP